MKKIRILFIALFIFYCKGGNVENLQALYELIFVDGGKRTPKLIFQKEVNIDLTPENEYIYIIRNGNEEILAILDNTKKNLLFKKVFTLLNIGPIAYDNDKNKWVASSSELKPDALFIIKTILFTKIGNDTYDSIFLEILSEEPPFELFSIPLVFRNYNLVFDGFALFKETKLLKELNRIPFSYIQKRTEFKYYPQSRILINFII